TQLAATTGRTSWYQVGAFAWAGATAATGVAAVTGPLEAAEPPLAELAHAARETTQNSDTPAPPASRPHLVCHSICSSARQRGDANTRSATDIWMNLPDLRRIACRRSGTTRTFSGGDRPFPEPPA